MNSSEARRVKGRGGGAQRECSESAARSRCRLGLAWLSLIHPCLGKDLFFWLGFQEGGRGKQAGWAKGRPRVAGLLR